MYLVVVDLLVALVVGGGEGDLIGDLVTDVGGVGIGPDGIAILVHTDLNLLVEVGSRLLVLIDDFHIGGVGVDGDGGAQSAADQVVAVGQLLELHLVADSDHGVGSGGVGAFCHQIAQVLDQLGVVHAFLLGHGAGVGIVNKEGVGGSSVCTEQCLEELVVLFDAVGDSLGSFAVSGHLDASIENLVDRIGLVDGCVGDGDRTGILCRKSGNAQRKHQSQNHHDGYELFHNAFSFLVF